MKYYINLIKRKKFSVLILSLLFIILGIAMAYYNSIEFILEGLKESGISPNIEINSGIAGIIGETNLGLAIIGLLCFYIGLVFFPISSPYAQDDKDYFVESMKDKVYIKYKNNEFLLDKETFSPTKIFFRDKNRKFVSLTRGYQIYNYVKYKYKKETEKIIDESKVIGEKEIRDRFNGLELMTTQQKEAYIKFRNIKKRANLFQIFLSISFWCISVILIYGVLSYNGEKMVSIKILYAIVAIIVMKFAKSSWIIALKNKKLVNKIMTNDVFIADCFSYDKKTINYDDGTTYSIKITDGKNYLDKWFKIKREEYNNEKIKGKLVYLDEDLIDVIIEDIF